MDQQNQNPTPPSGDEPQDAAPGVGPSRRALLRSGAAASPILLTLASGPVAATGNACAVASSFVSVATFASRSPGQQFIKCSNLNATHWQTQARNCTAWPFNNVVPLGWPAWARPLVRNHLSASNSSYMDWPVARVMQQGLAATGELAVLQNILGLTLTIDNSASSINLSTPVGGRPLSRTDLVNVWTQYRATGGFTGSGVSWDEAKLITWLKMLQYDIPVA